MGQAPAGKRKWEKPELAVLVRGKPEEGVLATCKTGYTEGGSGPSQSRTGRLINTLCTSNCDSSHTS